MIGPYKIRNAYGPGQKYEAECHWCAWTFFKKTIADAVEILTWHLDTEHINPQPPIILTADQMPGR